MEFWRRIYIKSWFSAFMAVWVVFFVSFPLLLAFAGANFFRAFWWFATAWLTDPSG